MWGSPSFSKKIPFAGRTLYFSYPFQFDEKKKKIKKETRYENQGYLENSKLWTATDPLTYIYLFRITRLFSILYREITARNQLGIRLESARNKPVIR
jgi:hypothetical protein